MLWYFIIITCATDLPTLFVRRDDWFFPPFAYAIVVTYSSLEATPFDCLAAFD